MTTNNCPLCRLPMARPGRLVAFTDDAGLSFTFCICPRCAGRLDRLPLRQQGKQLDIAINNLAKHPELYQMRFFDSEAAAHLFVTLEAKALRNQSG